MAGAVANLMVRAGADFSQLQRSMQQVQEQAVGFHSKMESALKGVERALTAVGLAVGIGEVVHVVKEGIQSAIELEATTQNLDKLLGQSAQGFIDWSKTTATAYGFSQVEAEKYGASFAHMISLFAKNTDDISQKTKDLMKTSAIIANGTGRSIDDVMQRIQSGMLGNVQAINDLGIYANQSMLEASKAFQQVANGRHWNDLSMAERQQVIYMSLMEQAAKQYGTTLENNVHNKLVTFTATIKNVGTALGNAFLPILNRVLPILTMMGNKLLQVMNIVAAFSQALFGKAVMGSATEGTNSHTQAINGQTGAVNGLANAHQKLAKAKGSGGSNSKSQGSVAGFDQVHTLPDKSASSGGAGASDNAGGLNGDSSIGSGINEAANKVGEVSEKVQAFVNKIKKDFADISAFLRQHASVIIAVLAGLAAGITTFLIGSNWAAIVEGVTVAFEALSVAISAISLPVLAVAAVVALFVGNLVYLWETNKKFRDSVIQVWNEISGFAKQVFNDMWSIVKKTWDKYGKDIWNGIKGVMKSIQDIILNLWNNFVKPILMDGIKTLRDLWDKHLKGLFTHVSDFVAKLIVLVLVIWNKFISPIVNYLIVTLGPKFASVFGGIFKVVGAIVGVVADVASNLFKSLGGIIDFITGVFTGNWSKAFKGLSDIVSGIFGGFAAIIKPPINAIIDIINKAIGKINTLKNSVPGAGSLIPDIPNIPHLYKGGITNGPTVAMIGDNAGGQEVVSPLDRLTGIMTNAVLTAMSYNTQGSGSNVTGDIILNIDGKQLARIIKPYTDLENKRVGTNLRLQSI